MRSRLPAGVLTPLTVGLTSAGALLLAAAPRFPGSQVWPLLAVLASVSAVVTVLLLVAGQRTAALGTAAATGVIAAGRALLDGQLLVAPATAVRPELAPFAGGAPGAWLLLAGELLTALGGLAAFTALERSGALAAGGALATSSASPAGTVPRAVGCAALAGVGLLLVPFATDGPGGPPRATLALPGWPTLGGLALVGAVVLAAVLAGAAVDVRVVVGGLVGAACGVLAVVLPRVAVAELTGTHLVEFGLVLALAGGFGLLGLAAWVGQARRGRGVSVPSVRVAGGSLRAVREPAVPILAPISRPVPDPVLDGALLAARCRLLGGRLGVLAGVCAVAAALTDPLSLAADLPRAELPTLRVMFAVGAALVPLGLATVSRSLGPSARPTLAVALVAVPMAAGEPLSDLLEVLGLDGVRAGPGLWLLIGSVAAALAGACALVLGGGFDREDVDLSGDRFDLLTASAASAAALVAVPAFWLPLINGAGWGVTGVLQPPFGLASWGLLAAFAVSVGALLIGPRCRPDRAASLLVGVAVVLVVRMVRLISVPDELPRTGLGEGAWATGLCILLVLGTGVIALRIGPWWVLSSVGGGAGGRTGRGGAREWEKVEP
ncbi:hypothetical protein [Pseudonocardia acaciae]|uniref:hypothetical protein n=1 Tax=Pseudonocardia acaciae TaxID=551276 RepID=UPI00048C7354|nr:hypothetical protein [Pseudonocardia acaciae]